MDSNHLMKYFPTKLPFKCGLPEIGDTFYIHFKNKMIKVVTY